MLKPCWEQVEVRGHSLAQCVVPSKSGVPTVGSRVLLLSGPSSPSLALRHAGWLLAAAVCPQGLCQRVQTVGCLMEG